MRRLLMDDERRLALEKLDGTIGPEDVARALNVSLDTLRQLGIPHVRLTRSSHVYFRDEVVAWLRGQERI